MMKQDFKDKVRMSWENFKMTGNTEDGRDFLQCMRELDNARKQEADLE